MASSDPRRPLWRRLLLVAAAGLGLAALVGVTAYWLVVPQMAAGMMRDKLASLEPRTGLSVGFDAVRASGLSGVEIERIEVADATGAALLSIDQASASLDLIALVNGTPRVRSVDLRGVELNISRDARGGVNLQRLADRLAGDPDDPDEPAADDPQHDQPAWLDRLGGELPKVTVYDAVARFSAEDGAAPWPVKRIVTDHFEFDSSGLQAPFQGTLELDRGPGAPSWRLPSKVDVAGELTLPIGQSSMALTFDPPLQISGVEPAPMVMVSLTSLAYRGGARFGAEGVDLGMARGDATVTLLDVGSIEASLDSLTTDPSKLRVMDLRVDAPTLFIERNAAGASSWNDLIELAWGKTARAVVARSRALAERLADDEDAEDIAPSTTPSGPLDQINWAELVATRAPQKITVTGAAVRLSDDRALALVSPARRLGLEDGRVELTHRAIQGELVLASALSATSESGGPMGKLQLDLTWNYRNGATEVDLDVERASLGWLVQMLGGRLDHALRAGRLDASLDVTGPGREGKTDFNGSFAVSDATLYLPRVAEEPIDQLNASYAFTGYLDPKAPIPPPELLRTRAHLVSGARPSAKPAAQIPQRGALVITSGQAQLNGVKAAFKPALFGLDFSARPTRFDLHVDLPKTPVMALFDAIPRSIQGPVHGALMKGDLAWTFHAEVPLWEAGDMRWRSRPELDDFQLVDLPAQVDVRRMEFAMNHTIVDDKIDFERIIEIPEMRPVPMNWLTFNTSLTEDEILDRREERAWPPRDLRTGEWLIDPWPAPTYPPTPSGDFDAQDLPADAIYPYDGQPRARVRWEGELEDHPYGPYQFVPLQFISAWMPRAVLTTEDNSFFKHDGFNWYALEESVEDNIEAGRFVRGASTVSMQLVKNLFLDQKKVVARKLREAFLVWLMEDVVDIPKARILEVYLNIIEFGPGIFGIHDAATHYFGKPASDLSLTEVAWLVSIVPNPKKYHKYYERGRISDAWFRRMLRYVAIMEDRRRARSSDVAWARDNKPEFYKPKPGEPMFRPRSPQRSTSSDIETSLSSWFGLAPSSLPNPQPPSASPEPIPSQVRKRGDEDDAAFVMPDGL